MASCSSLASTSARRRSPSIWQRTGAHGGQAFFGYSTNYLIDVDNAVIVDVEATAAIRRAEVLAAKRMIERSMVFTGQRCASFGDLDFHF